MKTCPNCGMQNPDENLTCIQCQTPLNCPDCTSKVSADSNIQQPITKKKYFIPAIIAMVLLVFGVLIFTHIICINHVFLPATCTLPQTCQYCQKTQGEPVGHHWMNASCKTPKYCTNCNETEGEIAEHKWQDATCDRPKTCTYCKETEGSALGHVEGTWKTTREASLVDTGRKELQCTVCGKAIDSKTIDAKIPKVDGKSFNFTDEEFIEWIESISAIEFELMDTDKQNTLYGVTNTNTDATGLLLLNHRKNDIDGEICLIAMHMYDDNMDAMVLVTYVGELINPSFSCDDAFKSLVYDSSYSKVKMTSTMIELLDDLDFAVLTPTAYLEYILS